MALTTPVAVPYASYLRVYEPLAAFPEPERSHWARYARRGSLPGAQDELRRSLADLVPVPPVVVPVRESADAFVAEVDGVLCVCPWRTRLRGWQALAGLGDELPAPVLDAAVPPVVRREAAADYDRWRERNPDARPWIRSATWHVPVRWFVLFADEEREYGKGAGGGAGGAGEALVLRYRTPMVQARRRVARALKVLREELEDSPLVDGLVDVGRWLEEFHPRSMVELDYGGLVYTIPEDQLASDHSAADTAEGLAALREGDGERASAVYERLTERWRAVRHRGLAS
ncbi:hypothetical protein [Streptomyces radiopugnans]|uniref:hypothetical protein n=1 Tax=Streptomyces radiopugnans TaxID=403935 RepID=UPI003F195641